METVPSRAAGSLPVARHLLAVRQNERIRQRIRRHLRFVVIGDVAGLHGEPPRVAVGVVPEIRDRRLRRRLHRLLSTETHRREHE
jgi:hypothetical protein